MMLFKNKSTNKKKYLYLSVLPLLSVVVISTLVFNTSKAKAIVSGVEVKLDNRGIDHGLDSKDKLVATGISNELVIQDTVKRKGGKINKGKKTASNKDNSTNIIFESAEILPEPPGGMTAFRKWIGDNYQYPQGAIDAGVKGTVEISFVVEKDGSFSDLKVVKDIGFGTGDAAVALLKKSKKWLPAIQNGKPVRISYTLPIRIDLTN